MATTAITTAIIIIIINTVTITASATAFTAAIAITYLWQQQPTKPDQDVPTTQPVNSWGKYPNKR